jgi:hypothetical protein
MSEYFRLADSVDRRPAPAEGEVAAFDEAAPAAMCAQAEGD